MRKRTTTFIATVVYGVVLTAIALIAFSTASVFIWHAIAADLGTSGTVWGECTASPLPALVVFLAYWTAVNIGFTIAALAEAFHRNRSGLFPTILVAMFVVALGITAGFLFLPEQPTGGALIVVVIAFPLSLLALAAVRSWAVTRVARWDAIHPRSALQTEACAVPGGPPFDLLRRGEELLAHFKSERTPEPQLLIATDQRFVRASILGLDRTFVLEQASPSQLTRVRSERVGHDLMTTAYFHDRQVMRVVGGDPEQSRAFAEAISRLVRSGKIPR